ncbi:MAG: O-antigen ligase family protein [Clostridia bacterium]|nr:O-antigen ligase family protein [Clostridia bacterium]
MNSPKEKKRPTLAGLVRGSRILGALERFILWIYDSLANGFFGRIFTSYDKLNRKFKGGLILTAVTEDEERIDMVRGLRRRLAQSVENSRILALFRRVVRYLLTCRLSFYGVLLFAFGVYSAILYPLHMLIPAVNATFSHLVVGTAVGVCSLPLLFIGESLASALERSRILSGLLFRVLGLHPGEIPTLAKHRPVGNLTFAFLAGVAGGVLTLAVPPLTLMVSVLILLVLLLILATPELGLLLTFFLTPYAPTMVMAALVGYTFLCYLLKFLLYKRTFRFELMDFAVFAFMLALLLGGLISVSFITSIKSVLVFLCFMLGYILATNLIRTKEWFDRCVGALMLSATGVALYGILQYVSGAASSTWHDLDMFSTIDGRVTSTLANPNVLAEYLVMVLPFVAAYFLSGTQSRGRFWLFLSGVSLLVCLVLTYSRGGWLGFLVAAVLFMLIYHRRTLYLLFVGVAALPFVVTFLPASIIQRFTSIGNLGDSSTSYRVYIWRAVLRMIGDNPFFGIGVGEGAFAKVYPLYTLSGIEDAPHSHNLFLQITLELGLIGLLIFLALLFFFAQHMCTVFKKTPTAGQRVIPAAGFCGIIGMLVHGMTDYVWYNYRIFLMFWLIIGLCCSCHRIERATPEAPPEGDIYHASLDFAPAKQPNPPHRSHVDDMFDDE